MGNDDQDALAGAAADDVSGGISTSGVGGEEVGTEGSVADAGIGGIDEVIEQARRTAWGRDGHGSDQLDDERT
ncbi:MAG: hypothetical protein ACLGI2_11965 [Acidimicrobiia bacterium]